MWLMRHWLLPEPFSKLQRVPQEGLHRHPHCPRMYVLRHLQGEIDVTEKITATSATQFQTQAMSKSSVSWDSEDAENEPHVPRLNQRTTRRHRQIPFRTKCVEILGLLPRKLQNIQATFSLDGHILRDWFIASVPKSPSGSATKL